MEASPRRRQTRDRHVDSVRGMAFELRLAVGMEQSPSPSHLRTAAAAAWALSNDYARAALASSQYSNPALDSPALPRSKLPPDTKTKLPPLKDLSAQAAHSGL